MSLNIFLTLSLFIANVVEDNLHFKKIFQNFASKAFELQKRYLEKLDNLIYFSPWKNIYHLSFNCFVSPLMRYVKNMFKITKLWPLLTFKKIKPHFCDSDVPARIRFKKKTSFGVRLILQNIKENNFVALLAF